MKHWLLARLAWLFPTLFGITFVTFLVLDLAPVDRAELEAAQVHALQPFADAASRDAAVLQLRVRYGMVDPVTFAPAPVWERYLGWLRNAATLHFAGPGGDHAALWRRLFAALPVTMLLGSLALAIAVLGGVWLGAWLGRHKDSPRERLASVLLLLGVGLPEFLLASLLLLTFCVGLHLLPAAGLRSPGTSEMALPWQVVDFAWHLVLPVLVMAIGPTALVARFVRDSVARTAQAPFVTNLRALGAAEELVRSRLLRHGCAPVATLAGSLLPMVVGGSIVVESLFALDGLGHLAFQAVTQRDQPLLMAIVVIGSVVTLGSLLLSDCLHRLLDARVRLQR